MITMMLVVYCFFGFAICMFFSFVSLQYGDW